VIVLSGCAHGYNAAQPERYSFAQPQEVGPLEVAYRTDVLEVEGNGGYADKAADKKAYPVAVRVKNTGSSVIRLSPQTFRITSPSGALIAYPDDVSDRIGQAWGWHALWGLLNVFIENGDGDRIWLPVGPVIGIINMVRGASANNSLEEDFRKKSIYDRPIEPGETATGLMFVTGVIGQPLTFTFDEQ
jgi:hypothetical protein